MDEHIVNFQTAADDLIDDFEDILYSDDVIDQTNLAELERRIGRLKYLINSIETKSKIINIVDNTHQLKGKPTENDKIHKNYCYECKTKIRSDKFRHATYDSMCTLCGNINMFKRDFRSNQKHKIAIVTGARVKIGYETALSLLKNGATVIATTRFVDDALERYSQESDYDTYKDNLYLYQLNMLDESNITNFVLYVKGTFGRVDYLINNAAQTIRRPKEFFKEEIQKFDMHNDPRIVYRDSNEINYILLGDSGRELCLEYDVESGKDEQTEYTEHTEHADQDCKVLARVQLRLDELFPPDKRDEFGQQIDLRKINSWMLNLPNIDIKELAEVFIINAIAPFVLCQKLVGIMGNNTKNAPKLSWIINVTSMEGIFNWKYKPTRHPHTNMAKAALNMMTRTCGEQYIEDGIIMVGVDTGWNNSQQPKSYERVTPIDCKDGSARILDPIYRRLKRHSVIYKDYKIIEF